MPPQKSPSRVPPCFLILGWFVLSGMFSSPASVSAQRGLSLVKIADQTGEPVILYKESHALIIGINNYTQGWPTLSGVLRDVQEVKIALEAHAFNIEVKMDLDKIALEEAFNEFISRYGQDPENRLLFYFAGHGHTVKMSYGEEIGYIVPVDAPNPSYDLPTFQSKAIDMQRIEYFAKRIQSKHALFLFDACFSGSLFALSRAVPMVISYKTAYPVRQFITSGSADEAVPDESIFRAQFARALQGEADSDHDGYVTGTELGEFLQTTVVNYSHNSQHPQYGKIRNPNLDKGDFVFKLPERPAEFPALLDLPPDSSAFSLEDLKVKADWQTHLENMENAFSEVKDFEQSNIPVETKIEAWERFVTVFAKDNPYSTYDEELHNIAQQRIAFWKTEHPTPTPEPVPTATPVPPTPTPTVTPEPAFQINAIEIKDASGEIIQPVEDIYTVKLGQPVTVSVDVAHPISHALEVSWTAFTGKVLSVAETTNTYTAQRIGADILLIQIENKETGDQLEEPLSIKVVQ